MQMDIFSCGDKKRHHNNRPDHEMIREFISLGKYPDGTIFFRADGEYWSVWCPLCASDEYAKAGVEPDTFRASPKAIRSGLLACRCSRYYHWSKPGRIYSIEKNANNTVMSFWGSAEDITVEEQGCGSCAEITGNGNVL